MEYLDVLDENGKPTGVKKPRSDIHNDGDWHARVHVWVKNSKNQVLLQKRSSNVRTYPDLWAYTIGGHILAGESPVDAIIREALEELALKLSKEDLRFAFTSKNQDIENNNQFDLVYIVNKDIPDLSILKMDPEEVSEIAWFEIDEFERQKRAHDPKFVPKSNEYTDNLFQHL